MGPKAKYNNSAKKSKKNKDSKSSYLAEDDNFQSFSNQLLKLGLELRDITGDGNCLFRALSDQMEGDESHHLEYRKKVCNYMRQNREEFEPFIAALIEDIDVANERKNIKNINNFEDYLKNLEKSGSYADNGCLVAFARLYKLDINIHQLNMPIWTINGGDLNNSATNSSYENQGYNARNNSKKNAKIKQLHLSYHNNEHYSSIRAIGDNTNLPTNICIQSNLNFENNSSKSSKKYSNNDYQEQEDETDIDYLLTSEFETLNLNKNNASITDSKNNDDILLCKNGFDYLTEFDYEFQLKVDQIMDVTKCMDVVLIRNKLIESGNDIDATVAALCTSETKDDKNNDKTATANKVVKPNKTDKKREKKQRQMERQKQKVAEENMGKFKLDDENENQSKMSDNNNNEPPSYSYSLNIITKAI